MGREQGAVQAIVKLGVLAVVLTAAGSTSPVHKIGVFQGKTGLPFNFSEAGSLGNLAE